MAYFFITTLMRGAEEPDWWHPAANTKKGSISKQKAVFFFIYEIRGLEVTKRYAGSLIYILNNIFRVHALLGRRT
jgi:hypothetical protein